MNKMHRRSGKTKKMMRKMMMMSKVGNLNNRKKDNKPRLKNR